MPLTKNERSVLQDLVRTLKFDFKANEVVLYGSAARGTLDKESDIDLFVVLPFVDWDVEKSVGGIAFEAGLEIDRVISTLCFSENDIRQPFRQHSPLLMNIRQEGILL